MILLGKVLVILGKWLRCFREVVALKLRLHRCKRKVFPVTIFQDIAQLIIERPTIMSPVLEEGIAGQETYQALLRLYTLALERAVHMPEANFSWVSL